MLGEPEVQGVAIYPKSHTLFVKTQQNAELELRAPYPVLFLLESVLSLDGPLERAWRPQTPVARRCSRAKNQTKVTAF